MKIGDLITLIQCPKRLELQQCIYHVFDKRALAFKQVLRLVADCFVKGLSWNQVAILTEQYLEKEIDETWYELSWQKNAAIREDLVRLKRLYYWMSANLNGKLLPGIFLSADFQITREGYDIASLDSHVDFMVERSDGSLTGVILCRKFSKPYSYYARKTENMVHHSVELLSVLMALERKFPDRRIEVMMISASSKKDVAGSFAIFEEKRGDNVICFTNEWLSQREEGIASEILRSVLESAIPENCQNCVYAEMCRTSKVNLRSTYVEEQNLQNERPQYTETQREAIHHGEGPMRICAGPGAGKTATLVARVKYLIEKGIASEKILTLAFTKKSAKEIAERIGAEHAPAVYTIHAMAFQLICKQEAHIGKKRLVNRVDCLHMLLQVLNQAPVIRDVNYEDLFMEYGLLHTLYKDFGMINHSGADEFQKAYPKKDVRGILKVKEMYDQKCAAAGYILFDDVIKMAIRLLENYPSVRKKMQESFQYILVDEVQDLDEWQARFVQLLVNRKCNIMICGDADQSIYGFRGGSNQFMLDFPQIYPGTRDIWLDENFRSSSEILTAANTLISHNTERVPFQMKPQFQLDQKPVLIEDFRTNRVSLLVQDLIASGYMQGEIAIIARTNRELTGVGEVLEQYNQEHPENPMLRCDNPKNYLYEDYTFQTLLDLLSIYLGMVEDDRIWYRLLSNMEIQIEKQDRYCGIYDSYLARREIYPMQGEESSRYLAVTEHDPQILRVFARIYKSCQLFSLKPELAVPLVFESYFDLNISYTEVLEILLEKIQQRSIRTAYELWEHMNAVKKFRDDTRLFYPDGSRHRLHLLTAHDAKGQEFPVVIILGVDDFERDFREEERRLLYVALTRAKKRLYITELHRGKSMFIREIKENLEIMGGIRYA